MVDKNSELAPTVVASSVNDHDVTQSENSLTGEEETVNGDTGYIGTDKRKTALVCK